ncbi:hypothetical protein OQA88_6187 [Cercophora sp. LCS_1]
MQLLAKHLLALSTVFSITPTPFVEAASLQPRWKEHVRTDDRDGSHASPVMKWLRNSAFNIFLKKSLPTVTWADPKDVHTRFQHDVVLRYNVTNPEEETALSRAAVQLVLDVWAFTPEYVDIRIHKDDVKGLRKLLPSSLEPTIIVQDVAAAVLATYPPRSSPVVQYDPSTASSAQGKALMDAADSVFFSDYQPLTVITSWMIYLQALFPSYTEITSIGKSAEGRDILAFRVGERSADETGPRKTILVTSGQHAREWIGVSTANYLLWSMVDAFKKDQMAKKLLQHFDIVFIPVLNPDGYDYTWHEDRLWRKSRQQTKTRFCRGLDLDHAFGYEWGSAEHQTDPCSESYGGEEPFQAVEASQLASWAKNQTENSTKFIGFLDLHSYSQQILFPYSYSCAVDPPNRENLEELAVGLSKAIRLSSGELYTVASACEGAVAGVYSASNSYTRLESGGGSAIDWFYHELHARYSYQIKLRDTGSYGFLLPKEHILPAGEEALNALKYFGDYLLGNNGIEKFPAQMDSEQDVDWKDLKE